ncbi:MAG TPA: M28 family metallopeptidase [Terriglobales bacterium]|nr:M28 family metallopeptidase [Terriglobales bacterium]
MAVKRCKGLLFAALFVAASGFSNDSVRGASPLTGFRNPLAEAELERRFLAVPDPRLLDRHMRILTAEPHIAGSAEDRSTADYVAGRFSEAGLETSIVEYRVWMNYPREISIDVTAPAGVVMHGPSKEAVDGDPFQDNPQVLPAFSGYSPSGDVEGEVVYANYGRPEDFHRLAEAGIDLRGKIVMVRYGENFRGVKAYLAQEKGAVGLIFYSDPMDDGYFKGDVYPRGPWRPATAVQRGTIEYGFEHPGDPTTPGFASVPSLPDSRRMDPASNPDMPRIPALPLSYHDAQPILANLAGPESPRDWQGALPFTYHLGPGPTRVKLHIRNDYGYRTIWNVIGRIRGSQYPDEWVIMGNHRDAWVYGAVDPISGTVAMLEAVRGLGELLKTGWRPKRTVLFASWDAEEQGLIGSTEWVEEHEADLGKAVAYFNSDTGGAGPNFRAAATPSLKGFLRDITKAVPEPTGGTLYDHWRQGARKNVAVAGGGSDTAQLGNLGSGSDYTPFLDHAGVPSSDVRSSGNYGVYHSVFDNYQWFRKFGDPGFLYSQMIARVIGMEVLRMANADVLPHDYEAYGSEIVRYLGAAEKHAREALGDDAPSFQSAMAAAHRFAAAGAAMNLAQRNSALDPHSLNAVLIATERELLIPGGLPRRPWFKHSIFAPADLKGYSASVIPGVNEAIENSDPKLAVQQLAELTAALNRAADRLESIRPAFPAVGQ